MIKNLKKSEWDKIAKWWDSKTGNMGLWHQKHDINPIIFEIIANIKNKKILDVGCGNGYLSRLLSENGAEVTGVDFSEELLALAISEEKTKPLGIKYLIRNATKLSGLENKSFDFVIANMVLMDVARAENVIKEASRVLKRNGQFVFSILHPVFRDFCQQWTVIQKKGKKYFARAIGKYLSSDANKFILWGSGLETVRYHRSLETYFKYLQNANFLISEFREIATKKKLQKTAEKAISLTSRSLKYKTLAEKKMKQLARKEIPRFLVIGAIKNK